MALSLDGSSQYINFGDVLDSTFAGADKKFAISLWFILNSDTATRRTFLAKHGASEGKKSWRLALNASDKLEWGMVFDNGGSAYRVVAGTTVITSTSAVYHLLVNYDGSVDTGDGADRISFYLNNVLESDSVTATGGVLGDIPSTTACLGVGALLKTSGIPDTAPEYGPFKIWDVRVYNRVLTANEIAEIYHHRGADRVWQGLVGWWRLDELTSGTPTPLLLDAMDSTTGWSASLSDSISLNTTTYQEGSGAINFIKRTTVRTYSWMYKTITSVNVTGQTIKLWIYIKDQTTLNKISSVHVRLYSTYDTDAKSGGISNADLAVGWNLFSKHINDFDNMGTPDITAITTLRVQVNTNNASDTISEGNLIFDFYRAGDYVPNSIIDLSGNGNHGAPQGGVYRDSPHRLRRGVLVS